MISDGFITSISKSSEIICAPDPIHSCFKTSSGKPSSAPVNRTESFFWQLLPLKSTMISAFDDCKYCSEGAEKQIKNSRPSVF